MDSGFVGSFGIGYESARLICEIAGTVQMTPIVGRVGESLDVSLVKLGRLELFQVTLVNACRTLVEESPSLGIPEG